MVRKQRFVLETASHWSLSRLVLWFTTLSFILEKADRWFVLQENGAQLMAKEGKYATLRLPSGEMRMVPIVCRATVGVIGNGDHNLINIGKAGRKRTWVIRPTVRRFRNEPE